MKRILILFVLAVGIIGGCKEKKSTPEPTVKKVEVEKEPEPVVEEVVEPEPIDEGVNIDNKYFVIVNSYAVADYAFEKLNQFKQEGYKPKLLMRNDNGYYCLALKSYDDFNEAVRVAEDLRLEREEFSGAWVLNRSNNKIEDKEE